MSQDPDTICFSVSLDDGKFSVRLIADVENLRGLKQYKIKNIRPLAGPARNVLPDMLIKKDKRLWVYSDSGKENNLTLVVGQALEQFISITEEGNF